MTDDEKYDSLDTETGPPYVCYACGALSYEPLPDCPDFASHDQYVVDCDADDGEALCGSCLYDQVAVAAAKLAAAGAPDATARLAAEFAWTGLDLGDWFAECAGQAAHDKPLDSPALCDDNSVEGRQ